MADQLSTARTNRARTNPVRIKLIEERTPASNPLRASLHICVVLRVFAAGYFAVCRVCVTSERLLFGCRLRTRHVGPTSELFLLKGGLCP